ncbi:hypothetical protein L209DRAFT_423784 [Thermothelomyces heterothallicus CBS 203.75]
MDNTCFEISMDTSQLLIKDGLGVHTYIHEVRTYLCTDVHTYTCMHPSVTPLHRGRETSAPNRSFQRFSICL